MERWLTGFEIAIGLGIAWAIDRHLYPLILRKIQQRFRK